jgi:hypothetical protein
MIAYVILQYETSHQLFGLSIVVRSEQDEIDQLEQSKADLIPDGVIF